jgi:hypothetical protein
MPWRQHVANRSLRSAIRELVFILRGWEVVATAVTGLVVTTLGVFAAIWINGYFDRRRARRRAITDAKGLLEEFNRLSLDNAPRGTEMMATLWPYGYQAMEIINNLSSIDPDLPAWFRGESYVFIDAAGDRAMGLKPDTTDFERMELELDVARELDRAVGVWWKRRKRGWHAAHTRKIERRKRRRPRSGVASVLLRLRGRAREALTPWVQDIRG